MWVWGGVSVSGATLNRFFSLHYLFPFILCGCVIVHLAALHRQGSNNPLGLKSDYDKNPFHPYYALKDTMGVSILEALLCQTVFFLYLCLGGCGELQTGRPFGYTGAYQTRVIFFICLRHFTLDTQQVCGRGSPGFEFTCFISIALPT